MVPRACTPLCREGAPMRRAREPPIASFSPERRDLGARLGLAALQNAKAPCRTARLGSRPRPGTAYMRPRRATPAVSDRGTSLDRATTAL